MIDSFMTVVVVALAKIHFWHNNYYSYYVNMVSTISGIIMKTNNKVTMRQNQHSMILDSDTSYHKLV